MQLNPQWEFDSSREQFLQLNSVRTAVIGILALQHQAKASLNNLYWVKTWLMPYLQDSTLDLISRLHWWFPSLDKETDSSRPVGWQVEKVAAFPMYGGQSSWHGSCA